MMVGRLAASVAEWLAANLVVLALARGGATALSTDVRGVALLAVVNLLWLVPVIGNAYVPRERIRIRGEARWYFLWMAGMLVILAAVSYDFSRRGVDDGLFSAAVWLGGTMIVLGFLVSLVAWLNIRRFSAPRFQIVEGHRVCDWGLYRYVRHPIYSGYLLIALGAPLFWESWWALAAFALVAAPIWHRVMTREEEFLVRHLGSAYRRYMADTKRLIPRVY